MSKFISRYDVILKMRSGWQLGESTAFGRSRSWLQKGGIGRGGETITVHGNTVAALRQRKLIELVGKDFPTQCYRLTGRKVGKQ
jgi:hypothetical protein